MNDSDTNDKAPMVFKINTAPRPKGMPIPKDDSPPTPNVLDLRAAAKRVTAREVLLCPMNWPDD
jgi:hypothetical protein